jgi:hypothetical protein
MGYKQHIDNLRLDQITEGWLIDLIDTVFKDKNSIITPLIIFEKIGIPIKNQTKQLEKKKYSLRIKDLLKQLESNGFLEQKDSLHDTVGIKEVAYKQTD